MSLLSDFLHLVKDFLFDNRRMSIVENLLIFFGILPLLLIPNGIGIGFEVDSSTNILFAFKNIDDGAFVPAIRILRLGVRSFHALFGFVCSGRKYLFPFKLFGNLARSTPVHTERENLFDHLCRFFVDDPFCFVLRIFAIAIRHMNGQPLATLTLCLLHCTNLSACVFCEKLVEPVLYTGNIAVGTVGIDTVKVVVDGNVPNIVLWKCVVDVQACQ